MDLYKIGTQWDYGDFTPTTLVEGYTSLIWTERFQEPGEFELTVPRNIGQPWFLPVFTLLTHRETNEVMMVEERVLQKNEAGDYELLVKGRSLSSFFEHRMVLAPYGKKRPMPKHYAPSGAAVVLMWNAIQNRTWVDVTRRPKIKIGSTLEILEPEVNPLDFVEGACITETVHTYAKGRRWWLEATPVSEPLTEILKRGRLGLRIIRPSGTNGVICTVKAKPVGDRGLIERNFTKDIKRLRFDVYQGRNRSHDQDKNKKVMWSDHRGNILNDEFFSSVTEWKNAIRFLTTEDMDDLYRGPIQRHYSGLRRRVQNLDIGEPEEPEGPDEVEDAPYSAPPEKRRIVEEKKGKYRRELKEWGAEKRLVRRQFREDSREMARKLLYNEYQRINLYSPDLSPDHPYVYNKHYKLGDKVTLQGKFGERVKMVVTEYVRTEDSTGDYGHPGFSTLEDFRDN